MMPGGQKRGRKHEEAVAALLVESTLEAAARKSGVSERTLRNWLKDPDFVRAYRDARWQIVEAAVARLQQAAAEAVDALKRNLSCSQPGPEIRAALGILDHSQRGIELNDLAERVEALEAQARERQGAGTYGRKGLAWRTTT
jgi:hypothetical protein